MNFAEVVLVLSIELIDVLVVVTIKIDSESDALRFPWRVIFDRSLQIHYESFTTLFLNLLW